MNDVSEQEDAMLRLVDKIGARLAKTLPERATRAERIAIGLLGNYLPVPQNVHPDYAAALARLAHQIAVELDEIEHSGQAPTIQADPPPQT